MKYKFIDYDSLNKIARVRVADTEENLLKSPTLSVSILKLDNMEELEYYMAKVYLESQSASALGEYSLALEQQIKQMVATSESNTAAVSWETARVQTTIFAMSDDVDHDGLPSGTIGPDFEIV
jgi:hypothetical protein